VEGKFVISDAQGAGTAVTGNVDPVLTAWERIQELYSVAVHEMGHTVARTCQISVEFGKLVFKVPKPDCWSILCQNTNTGEFGALPEFTRRGLLHQPRRLLLSWPRIPDFRIWVLHIPEPGYRGQNSSSRLLARACCG
jgi:hypothetical protein